VGQLEYSLSPCRSASLASTSSVSKGTSSERRICTTVWENPHCGKSLVPFMNSTTLCELTTLSRVACISGLSAAKHRTDRPRAESCEGRPRLRQRVGRRARGSKATLEGCAEMRSGTEAPARGRAAGAEEAIAAASGECAPAATDAAESWCGARLRPWKNQ
jgi:hypothetical protein